MTRRTPGGEPTCASGERAKALHGPRERVRIVPPGECGRDGAQAGLGDAASAARHVPAAGQRGRRRGAHHRLQVFVRLNAGGHLVGVVVVVMVVVLWLLHGKEDIVHISVPIFILRVCCVMLIRNKICYYCSETRVADPD